MDYKNRELKEQIKEKELNSLIGLELIVGAVASIALGLLINDIYQTIYQHNVF